MDPSVPAGRIDDRIARALVSLHAIAGVASEMPAPPTPHRTGTRLAGVGSSVLERAVFLHCPRQSWLDQYKAGVGHGVPVLAGADPHRITG